MKAVSFGEEKIRDGISVKNSTDEYLRPKIAHKMREKIAQIYLQYLHVFPTLEKIFKRQRIQKGSNREPWRQLKALN